MRILLLLIFLTYSLFAWKMEADTMVVKNTTDGVITHIDFRQTYDTVPLVFTLTTDVGGDPASLRVVNVTQTGFDVYSVEPDGEDGPHAKMSAVPYIAVEEGSHELPDGSKIVASKISTAKFQSKLLDGDSWESISLSGFNTTPIVLGEIQTKNSERTDETVPDAVSLPWMTTVIRSVSSSGFDIALERSETTTGTVQNEDIAYLVMESGLNGDNSYFASSNAKKIEYETIRSDDIIRGWDDSSDGYVVNFSKTYAKDPIVVMTKNSRDGVDGGWLRRRDISEGSIALVVDEDQANDSERSHTTEIGGLLLFSEPFDVNFVYTNQAEMKINEILYQEINSETDNEEFVEFLVTKSGNLEGYILSDQDKNYYIFPSFSVLTGDYVVYHTGSGSNGTSNGVHHFYRNTSPILNNTGDDVLLLKPSQDRVLLADDKIFNAEPLDYVAYETESTATVDPIPTSENAVTLSWDYSYATELDDADDGLSISLSPNGTDSDASACWEFTASGNASDNGCSGYIITRNSSDDATLTYSLGEVNTALPDIKLSKSSLTLYDPINIEDNPKAIPGALVKYIIHAQNEGIGKTDNDTVAISDAVPENMKMCVDNVDRCLEAEFVDGAVSSELTLGTVAYSDNGGTDFNYTPVADAEGYDMAVTNVQVKLNGSFKESDETNHPSFDIKFYMGVK